MIVCPDQGQPLTAIENLINKTIPTLPLEGFEAYRRTPRRETAFKEIYSTAATRSPYGALASAERGR
jgi:ATP-dependent RNA helicase DeaD